MLWEGVGERERDALNPAGSPLAQRERKRERGREREGVVDPNSTEVRFNPRIAPLQ